MQPSGSLYGSQEFNVKNTSLAQGSLSPVYNPLPNVFSREGVDTYGDSFLNGFFGNVETFMANVAMGIIPSERLYTPKEIKEKFNIDSPTPMNQGQIAVMQSKIDRDSRMAMRTEYYDKRWKHGWGVSVGRDFVLGGVGGLVSPSNLLLGGVGKAMGLSVMQGIAFESAAEVVSGVGLKNYGYNYTLAQAAIDVAAPMTLGYLTKYISAKLGKDLDDISLGKTYSKESPISNTKKAIAETLPKTEINVTKSLEGLSTSPTTAGELVDLGNGNFKQKSFAIAELEAADLGDQSSSLIKKTVKTATYEIPSQSKVTVDDAYNPEILANLKDALSKTEYAADIEDMPLDKISKTLDWASQETELSGDDGLEKLIKKELNKDMDFLLTEEGIVQMGEKKLISPDPEDAIYNVDEATNKAKSQTASEEIKKAAEESLKVENEVGFVGYSEIFKKIGSIDVDSYKNVESELSKLTEELKGTLDEFGLDFTPTKKASLVDKALQSESNMYENLIKAGVVDKLKSKYFYHTGTLSDFSDFSLTHSKLNDVFYGAGLYGGTSPAEGFTYIGKLAKLGMGDTKKYTLADGVKLLDLKGNSADVEKIVRIYYEMARKYSTEAFQFHLDSAMASEKDMYKLWHSIRKMSEGTALFNSKTGRRKFFTELHNKLKKTGYDGIEVIQLQGKEQYNEVVLWGLKGSDFKDKLVEVPTNVEIVAGDLLKKGMTDVDTVLKAGIFCVGKS